MHVLYKTGSDEGPLVTVPACAKIYRVWVTHTHTEAATPARPVISWAQFSPVHASLDSGVLADVVCLATHDRDAKLCLGVTCIYYLIISQVFYTKNVHIPWAWLHWSRCDVTAECTCAVVLCTCLQTELNERGVITFREQSIVKGLYRGTEFV